MNKVKSRCRHNIFNFELEAPLTVEDSLIIDRKNGNTLCHDSIGKYMNNYKVAFNFLYKDNHATVGYKEIICHLIFDVKMDTTVETSIKTASSILNYDNSRKC